LRTCAIGESDIDRRIDDLMRLNNPTVGLAAHPGQVDIRITAKAPTAQDAFDLIAPIEADIRSRLGDYIFGSDQETLAEVVGGLLKQGRLKLALVDTLAEAVVAQQLREAGYSEQLHSETVATSLADALTVYGLAAMEDGEAAAMALAGQSAQPGTVGLSIVGPTTADDDSLVWLATSYKGQTETRRLRSIFADTSRQSWLIIQAFDLVRRWFI
jgi:nicotinamide-nucleotide amidase